MSWVDMAIFTGVAAVGYFIVAGVLNLFKSKRADAGQAPDGFPPLGPAPHERPHSDADVWDRNRADKLGGPSRSNWEPPPLEEQGQPAVPGRGAFSEFERRCPNRNCNESNAPDSQFCRRCGARL